MSTSNLFDLSLFADRHCGLSKLEEEAMLKELGLSQLEDMMQAIPADIQSDAPDIGESIPERRVQSILYNFAKRNKALTSMIGLGYYGSDMPAIIHRKLFEDPAWYTAYTPYQPEIAQGRLEMLMNFQTMIADLTGLPMAGASLLDESTATAEAMGLFYRECKSDATTFIVDSNTFPQTLAILKTRAEPLGINVVVTDTDDFTNIDNAFGALISYPGADGKIADYTDLISQLQAKDILVACTTDLLALSLIKTPGEMGADVAVGSAQRFGLPMGGGGPHPGFIAFREKFKMRVPGRIVGVSKDRHNNIAYRLSLQSREQHIRREKATSNICTAQALPAMLAAAFAVYHGPERIRAIALHVQHLTEKLASGLKSIGYIPTNQHFFGTVFVRTDNAASIVQSARERGINLYLAQDGVGISIDEIINTKNITAVLDSFVDNAVEFENIIEESAIPESLKRNSKYLTHPTFNSHQTEQKMLRYLRSLAEKDISLNRSMIPLGSCTMKLNAAIEMEPLSWPQYTNIHPFAPTDQQEGYRLLHNDLASLLCKITGFDAASLQPNAGAQGEYAGLLTIRSYLKDKGEAHRNICLIPKSAHGTNAASAVMAGMKVIALEIDNVGQVALDDLQTKITEHGDNIAALMLTYPSTCGVFGKALREICDMVHQAGGQVYMDGANLNALVGVCQPGKCGPDVMHINLHKTFCIPHGGGGPGMGPIVAGQHLADYLPDHPMDPSASGKSCGVISQAPYGSALINIIPWLYIRLMGKSGLRRATLTALLNANYLSNRLSQKFTPYFIGDGGFVAHECIVDMRDYKKRANITVDDIAKRLMDFGFHAPTVSWPVAGAMMIEPTESESKAEIDRFCDALLHIASEVEKIENNIWPKDNNPLVNAPHTAEEIVNDDWQYPYSRSEAVYPLAWVRKDKYWPPIARIDAAYGDRNLICSCPPLEDFIT